MDSLQGSDVPAYAVVRIVAEAPTTGSELSLMVFRNMSSSETTGNFPAALTQYFTGKHWPSTRDKRLGIPFTLALDLVTLAAARYHSSANWVI
jgi:hypothetical protein